MNAPPHQEELFRAIAASSGLVVEASASERAHAHAVLQQWNGNTNKKQVAAAVLEWIPQPQLYYQNCNITIPTKLFGLTLIQNLLHSHASWKELSPQDRWGLQQSLWRAAQQSLGNNDNDDSDDNDESTRILSHKFASVLADLAVREFPQEWPTFLTDLFAASSPRHLALACLVQIMEDCTDSDFNASRVVTARRRNDVLLGLNEGQASFLPLIFGWLETSFVEFRQAQSSLSEMHLYLHQHSRKLVEMTAPEATLYRETKQTLEKNKQMIQNVLGFVEKSCQAMPLEWMFGGGGEGEEEEEAAAANRDKKNFVQALWHFMLELSFQTSAAHCLELLAQRKLSLMQWMSLLEALVPVVHQVQQLQVSWQSQRDVARAVGGGAFSANNEAWNVQQLPFYRALSKLCSTLLSAHLAHITTDKDLAHPQHAKRQTLVSFLELYTHLLSQHPSGLVASEQMNTWTALLREPQVSTKKLLEPYLARVLVAFMQHTIRIPWEDVQEGRHAQTALLEESWTDKEEYDLWLSTLRSKASQLFKLIAHTVPDLAATLVEERTRHVLTVHGNGEPRNHVDFATNRLTPSSEAILQLEGLCQPLENVLQGVPNWTLQQTQKQQQQSPRNKKEEQEEEKKRQEVVQTALANIAQMIVSWNPADVWLKFRRATLLDALKHYWKHNPKTLLAGVDALLVYLSAQDEWETPQPPTQDGDDGGRWLSGDVVGLRKKSGVALVSISKRVPEHLVGWLQPLSERATSLLSSTDAAAAASGLLAPNRMHLYEFLSCVATAVPDATARAQFVGDVLAPALVTLESPPVVAAVASVEGLLEALGIAAAGNSRVDDATHVARVTARYVKLFSALNQLLSVGKRCHEAARQGPQGGIPLVAGVGASATTNTNDKNQSFADEGPVSLADLATQDAFVPQWPRFLPTLMRTLDVVFSLWHAKYQALLLRDVSQRFVYAISDDEAYLATKLDTNGGVFGPGGTAGSVVSGSHRRDANLVPKWAGWFNELRNTCLQLLGLLAAQRVLFCPELGSLYKDFCAVVANPLHLQSMEHRHLTQYLKQFIEILLLSCPATLYSSHLAPILRPLMEHVQYRLHYSWEPVIGSSSLSPSPLTSATCEQASVEAASGGTVWFHAYYARAGMFVGDLDSVTAEAAAEKARIDLTRSFSDVLQAALALKGDWALVLANQAKEELAIKKNDPSRLFVGPRTRIMEEDASRVNADGTLRSENNVALEARKSLRIHNLCRFLLLEDVHIAGHLTMSIIQCLEYPDAYTCRRCTRICHRILETTAWVEQYTDLLGNKLFTVAVKAIVTEPKWMVGIEWDIMNLIRDIYCRLVLGQTLLPGGQGPAMQHASLAAAAGGTSDIVGGGPFEQAKTVDQPLQGGGILVNPSNVPRQILQSLPGMNQEAVGNLENLMMTKRSAKEQKDVLRELLSVAAEAVKQSEGGQRNFGGLFGRAVSDESLLQQQQMRRLAPELPPLVKKKAPPEKDNALDDASAPSLGDVFKLSN